MSKISTEDQVQWIESPEQIECLTSPVRQEIVDSLAASGPASIGELARELGLSADSLYYHVRKLLRVGLIAEEGLRRTRRREEAVYGLVKGPLSLRYEPSDPVRTRMICRLASTMLRVAAKDFESGFAVEKASTEGEERNLWCARFKAWLSAEQVHEVNRLLNRLLTIFETRGDRDGTQLCTLTWALSPVAAQPLRREDSRDA